MDASVGPLRWLVMDRSNDAATARPTTTKATTTKATTAGAATSDLGQLTVMRSP